MFIAWKTDVKGFDEDYFSITNEKLQEPLLLNMEETHYMIGSGRITDSNLEELSKKYDFYFGKEIPAWWNEKQEDDF